MEVKQSTIETSKHSDASEIELKENNKCPTICCSPLSRQVCIFSIQVIQ